MKKLAITAFLTIALISSFAYAEKSQKETKTKERGLITSSVCPYSCKDEGLSKDECREWQKGTKCYVEDLNQAPGHRSRFVLPKK